MVRMSAAPWGRAMLQISVEQALVVDQGMKVAISGRPYVAAGQRFGRVGTQQLFSRWDGFTLTFPEPEVFGLSGHQRPSRSPKMKGARDGAGVWGRAHVN